ncbi:MAG TPA: sialidase family protein [Myxococcaceae bacterium]|nr:sialidase family protein [Myxococcaceae bacterium]
MKLPASPRPWSLLLASLALRSSPVLAHAGLPETSSITLRRGQPADLIAGATFGAVVSRDGGRNWRWICPESMGYVGAGPSAWLWLSSGELLAATGSALIRSSDGGCTWQPLDFFTSQGLWPSDVASPSSEEGRLWVTTGRASVPNGLYRSDDGGASFTATPLQRSDAVFTAVRVAPSEPRRLYVSGATSSGPRLYRSDDEGLTWEELPQPLSLYSSPSEIRLQKVDDADPDHLWVSLLSRGFTYVLESRDGGHTLQEVLKLDEPLVNVEASADGRTFWAASITRLFQLQAGTAPVPLSLPDGNACVRREGSFLYACGSSWVHGWALARSRDQGRTWTRLLSLPELRGVLDCPAGTPTHDVCSPRWPQLAETLGASSQPPDAGTSAPVPDAGTPGSAEDAGTSAPGPDAGTPGGSPPPPPAAGCSTTGGLLSLASLLTLTALWRSRRRA